MSSVPAVKKSSVIIALVNPKSPNNVGMIMRAAGCFAADEIIYSGERFERARRFSTDTHASGEHIALTHVDDLVTEVPRDHQLVGIELVEGAEPLMDFIHPERAVYLFGPEDGSLSQSQVDACDHVIYIPTLGCLNLACTVNVVLYDRLAKSSDDVVQTRPISENKDVNNRTRVAK